MQHELETAEAIAREAGELVMGYYRGDFQVDLKNETEPVTEADRVANNHIVRRLREEFPQDAIIAEESTNEAAAAEGVRRVWMVDPMDGTKEFIKHTDEFAVMIGLAVEGRPQLGVVNQPATRTLYRGIVGDGAESDIDGKVSAMKVSDRATPADLRLICSRSHLPDVVQKIMEDLGITEMVRSGSVGLKIGRIATQSCDLYLHPSIGTKLWDACAPEAILAAAGGALTDFDGNPVKYDPAHLHNVRGLLASNGAIHAELAERLRGYY
ncbi:MAG: 3'(2'),5'-bisphosphate nucleotidase CysQ [Acidobacteria bacterium]|nr:3'(2'),5'-bisphosphate nucleotidase CysQ [Acidobacteriota bacterium]